VASSVATTDSSTTVSTNGVVEIEEGQQIVIHMDGPAARVVDWTQDCCIPILVVSFEIDGPVARVVDWTPERVSYIVDDWYLVFNRMEAIASPPVVAVR
jgi:hypothetical protein